jgi:hypothetical protein
MPDVKIKGRKLSPLELEVLGEISENDLLDREEGALTSSQPSTLAKIRGIHHEIARQLASGLTSSEVSATTGYSLSRISILTKDPSFKELLAFYNKKEKEVFVDVRKRMAVLGLDAASELQDRLENAPESLSNSQLIEITKATLDRAGYSPVSKNINVGVSISSDELEALKASSKNSVRIFDVMPQEELSPNPIAIEAPAEISADKGTPSNIAPSNIVEADFVVAEEEKVD